MNVKVSTIEKSIYFFVGGEILKAEMRAGGRSGVRAA